MPNELPGQYNGLSSVPNDYFISHEGMRTIPAQQIDSSKSYDGANTGKEYELRRGTLMGLISATNKWCPCKRTVIATGGSGTTTSIVVTDARAFQVGDTISMGADTDKVISAIDYGTNTISYSGNTTTADGEAVVAQDGSQTCRGILDEEVNLYSYHDHQLRDKTATISIAGFVNQDKLFGDADAIRAASGQKITHFQFGDDHNMS